MFFVMAGWASRLGSGNCVERKGRQGWRWLNLALQRLWDYRLGGLVRTAGVGFDIGVVCWC